MSSTRTGLAVLIGFAFLPLLGIVFVWQFSPGGMTLASGSRHSQKSPHLEASVGASRGVKLKLLTQQYLSLNQGVSSRVEAGTELAPIEFLNQQLKREGVKWRVREVNGLVADTYDIS
ncbi:MAG: hypothetical protein R3E09_08960 [Novosphingobium sp.]|nr:hypothetical protein [Novosphingobium sp.]